MEVWLGIALGVSSDCRVVVAKFWDTSFGSGGGTMLGDSGIVALAILGGEELYKSSI